MNHQDNRRGGKPVSKQKDDESAFGVATYSPDITAQCAALDALVMIELPMRAAMTSVMVAQAQYASQIAICEMQRAASLENAAIERHLAETYARQANTQISHAPQTHEKQN